MYSIKYLSRQLPPQIKHLLFYPLLLTFFLVVNTTAIAQGVSLHVNSGAIRVKMESENILPPTPSQAGLTRQSMPLETGLAQFDALNRQYNVSSYLRLFPDAGIYEQKHRDYDLHLWYDLFIDEYADPQAVATEYASVAGVLAAEPIYRIAQKGVAEESIGQYALTTTTFNDPNFGKQWSLKNDGTITGSVANADINVIEAWQINTGSKNVTVCVVDEGVDYTHADLSANIWTNPKEIPGNGIDDDNNGFIDDIHGFNFVTKSGDIIPGNHGTFVAGIIAAANNNGIGVSGIAGGNGNEGGVKVMSAQTFRGAASATAAPAYVYAADNGAVIAQSSWGYSVPEVQNQSDIDAIKYFIEQAGKDHNGNPRPNTPMVGGIVIFSAGNAGDNSLWYPAAASNVVAVASIGVSGKKPAYSNYGSWVDITAPGGDAANGRPTIYSTMIKNSYGYNQGTSFSCPHVSGVAALILSKFGHSRYTPDSLRVKLEATATPLFDFEPDYALYMGSGLLNAGKAMLPFIPTTGISLPSTIDLEIGETYTPTGFIQPAYATDLRMKWTNSDPTVLSVDVRGRFTGLKAGSSQVTGTTYDGKFSKTCTVNVSIVTAKEIHISSNELSLSVGDTHQLSATLVPSNVANPTIIWSTSDKTIATISTTGEVTALKEGKCTIKAATANGSLTDQCSITITPTVNGISISPEELILAVGQKLTLKAEVLPSNATRKNITWSSSEPSYATVDNSGTITAVKAGKYGESINVKITATTQQGFYTDVATVVIKQDMIIPEGFSPNNDGINDFFQVPLSADDTYTLRIFDRSGQLCYESTNYQNNWEGVANFGNQKGEKVASGTYYYVLISKNSNEVKKGYTIIRY